MEPSWHQNHIQKRLYVKIARKQKVPIFPIEFNDFSRFGDRFWEAKSTKNRLKNGIQDSMPKFNPLWTENLAQDTSKTPPRRPHDAPRRPQDGPKTPQDDPKTAQVSPRTTPKTLSRHPQARSGTAGRWGTLFLPPWADGVPHFCHHGPMGYPVFG